MKATQTDGYLIFNTGNGKLYYGADGGGYAYSAAIQIAGVKGCLAGLSYLNFIAE